MVSTQRKISGLRQNVFRAGYLRGSLYYQAVGFLSSYCSGSLDQSVLTQAAFLMVPIELPQPGHHTQMQ